MEESNAFIPEHRPYTNSRYMYVNSAAVATGDNDFIMKLETNLPDGLGEEVNLIMTPRIAKQIRDVLNNAVVDYEDIVGEIYMGSKVLDKYGQLDLNSNDE